jgi:L-serine dehydratase
MMFTTIEELVELANKENNPISTVMVAREMAETGKSKEAIFAAMSNYLDIMEDSINRGLTESKLSSSGLTGGDAKKISDYAQKGETLLGNRGMLALSMAYAVSETNASLGKIVATPTAGSAGILPGILFSLKERHGWKNEVLLNGLFTASAIGFVIANNASISGAGGGCQAEVGSATAMAAGAAVELAGGTPSQVKHAVALALKNVIGLVCDPIAGLVEIPCIVRNGVHAVMALTAADLALAGVKSVIPADEVISTLNQVGSTMPKEWKETALGGLAATPTGIRIKNNLTRKG